MQLWSAFLHIGNKLGSSSPNRLIPFVLTSFRVQINQVFVFAFLVKWEVQVPSQNFSNYWGGRCGQKDVA